MKITVSRAKFRMRGDQFLRQYGGYAHIHDRHSGHDSYVRRLTRDHYPRFHVYIKELEDRIIFDLHLDQKKTSYSGSHMHNAEYDGDAVGNEIDRIKSVIIDNISNANTFDGVKKIHEDTLEKVSKKDYIKQEKKIKKSFWKKILPF